MNRLLFTLIAMIATVAIQAQCFVQITPTVNEQTVAFTTTTAGSPVATWSWDFGDGGTSTEASPTYTYNMDGTYEICATIVTTDSCTATGCDIVNIGNVGGNCDAFFITETGDTPFEVEFYDFSVGAMTWQWDFGNGAVSPEQNPTYTFPEAGEYQVGLTIVCADGSTSSTVELVIVEGETNPEDCFTITEGLSPYPASDPIFQLVIEDDSYCCTDGWDEYCQSSYDYYNDGGGEELCVAIFFPQVSEYDPFSYFFESEDDGINANTYNWDFGDGNTVATTDPEAIYTYTESGVFEVCLTIMGIDDCEDTYCQNIAVGDVDVCQAEFQALNLGDFGYSDMEFGFISQSLGAESVSWDFGDGTTDNSGEIAPSHEYESPGIYDVCLTITCDDNETNTYCETVTAGDVIVPLTGSISGVTQDEEGNVVGDIEITLTDANGNTEVTISDESGSFSFDNLELGDYSLSFSATIPDTSFDTEDATVTISDNNTDVSLTISGDYNVVGLFELGIESMKVFPNPVKDVLWLEYVSINNMELTIKITDGVGRVIEKSVLRARNGQNNVSFNSQMWSSGVYVVTIEADGKVAYHHKFLKN